MSMYAIGSGYIQESLDFDFLLSEGFGFDSVSDSFGQTTSSSSEGSFTSTPTLLSDDDRSIGSFAANKKRKLITTKADLNSLQNSQPEGVPATSAVANKNYRYYDRRIRPFPRVLKRDIRRSYPQMFMNSVNSHDRGFLMSFLETICTPSVFMDTKIVCGVDPKNPDAPLYPNTLIRTFNIDVRRSTLREVAEFFIIGFNTAPDMTLTVDSARILQRLGRQGSSIVCNVTINATKQYLNTIDFPRENSEEIVDDIQRRLREKFKISDPSKSVGFRHPEDSRLILLPEPVNMKKTSVLTINLDEENQVTSLSIVNEKFGSPYDKDLPFTVVNHTLPHVKYSV